MNVKRSKAKRRRYKKNNHSIQSYFFCSCLENAMEVYVATEGFTLPCGYVVKELCIMYPNHGYEHYLLQPPVNQQLSEIDYRTIRFATKNLNNLAYHDGDIPYTCIPDILKKIRYHKIFTYSEITLRCLQEILPTTVITNIQALGFKMPSTLPGSTCVKRHNPRYCALSKAIAVKNFMNS